MQASESHPRDRASRRAWIWPIALAAVIFAWSSRSTVPDVGGWIPHFDKVVHFSVYGVLGVQVARTGLGARRALVAVALASLYGVSDEWHQSFVPGRSAEVADWSADTMGAILAVGVHASSPRVRRWLELPARAPRRSAGAAESISNP